MYRSLLFFFSSRRRHTRLVSDWSSDVCSSDLNEALGLDVIGARAAEQAAPETHGPKITCGRSRSQCSFSPHARPAPPPPPAPAPPPCTQDNRARPQDAPPCAPSGLAVLRRAGPGVWPQGFPRVRIPCLHWP